MPVENRPVRFFAGFAPIQLRSLIGFGVLGIGHGFRIPSEADEFSPAAFGYRLADSGIFVIGEVLEWRRGREFLTLKKHWDEGPEQDQRRGNFQLANR